MTRCVLPAASVLGGYAGQLITTLCASIRFLRHSRTRPRSLGPTSCTRPPDTDGGARGGCPTGLPVPLRRAPARASPPGAGVPARRHARRPHGGLALACGFSTRSARTSDPVAVTSYTLLAQHQNVVVAVAFRCWSISASLDAPGRMHLEAMPPVHAYSRMLAQTCCSTWARSSSGADQPIQMSPDCASESCPWHSMLHPTP